LPARRDCSMASASATTPSQNPSSCDTRASQTYYYYEASIQTSGMWLEVHHARMRARCAAACERGATVMHGACERVEVLVLASGSSIRQLYLRVEGEVGASA
jgi:hypothetical protein